MKPNINSNIAIIGVPLDLGAGTRGVNLGPDAIRYAGVEERLKNIGYNVEDLGDIPVNRSQAVTEPNSNLKNLNVISEVNSLLSEKVFSVMSEGKFPLVLGGDHSIAIGTISGVLKYKKSLGVIWFDAHGDINTPETSPSGNIHGMPVAVLLGLGDKSLTKIVGENNFLKKRKYRLYRLKRFGQRRAKSYERARYNSIHYA